MTSEGQNGMAKNQSVLPEERPLEDREARRDSAEVPADARREAESADVVRKLGGSDGDSGATGESVARFFVPGEPVAKGRPRASTIGGKARLYTPAKTQNYENLVRLACTNIVAAPLFGPCAVSVEAVLPIPQSWSEKRTRAALDGAEKPTKRPDLDNYLKAILDGMNGVAFADDCQVVEISARKRYGSRPGVWVELIQIGGAQ